MRCRRQLQFGVLAEDQLIWDSLSRRNAHILPISKSADRRDAATMFTCMIAAVRVTEVLAPGALIAVWRGQEIRIKTCA